MLQGERIRLRVLEPADARTIAGWHETHEFTVLDGSPFPTSLAQTEAWLAGLPPPSFAQTVLGVINQAGDLIGYLSLRRMNPTDRNAEFGIALGPAHWNQGCGTDATRTLIRFAFAEMNLHRVTLRVADYNPRARRVYEKVGFKVEGVLREARWWNGAWHDTIVMGLLAHEFLAADRARTLLK